MRRHPGYAARVRRFIIGFCILAVLASTLAVAGFALHSAGFGPIVIYTDGAVASGPDPSTAPDPANPPTNGAEDPSHQPGEPREGDPQQGRSRTASAEQMGESDKSGDLEEGRVSFFGIVEDFNDDPQGAPDDQAGWSAERARQELAKARSLMAEGWYDAALAKLRELKANLSPAVRSVGLDRMIEAVEEAASRQERAQEAAGGRG